MRKVVAGVFFAKSNASNGLIRQRYQPCAAPSRNQHCYPFRRPQNCITGARSSLCAEALGMQLESKRGGNETILARGVLQI